MANAQFALIANVPTVIPIFGSLATVGADFFLLTKNQLLLIFKIAAIHGEDIHDSTRIFREMVPVVGAGFFWRTIAREAAAMVPMMGGAVPKVAIAYTGTMAIGRAADFYYTTGAKPSKEMMKGFYQQAAESLSRRQWLLRRNPKETETTFRVIDEDDGLGQSVQPRTRSTALDQRAIRFRRQRFRHRRLEDSIDSHICAQLIAARPESSRQTGQIGSAQCGRFQDFRPNDLDTDQVGMELQQAIVGSRATVDLEGRNRQSSLRSHEIDQLHRLQGDPLDRGVRQMTGRRPPVDPKDASPRGRIPMRRTEPDQRRHEDHPAGIVPRCPAGARCPLSSR